MIREPIDPQAFYAPAEVAVWLKVDAKSVTRWDRSGRFPEGSVIRTLGGHRRIRGSALLAMLAAPKGRQS